MPDSSTTERAPRSITARVLAPLALVGVLVVVAAMVSTTISNSSDDDDQEHATRTEQQKDEEPKEETYTVQPGDTLISISEDTGVSVEKIERRNPDLDPQTLNAGQVIQIHD